MAVGSAYSLPESPPDDLVEALRKGDCTLFAGSELSVAAGYPSWEQFLRELIDWCLHQQIIDREHSKSLLKSIEADEPDDAAESIADLVKEAKRHNDLVDNLKETWIASQRDLTPIIEMLGQIPFVAAITPNYDDLLERAFSERFKKQNPLTVFTPLDEPADLDRLQKEHARRDFFLLKLKGWLERPNTVILSSIQYRDVTYGNQIFTDFFASHFLSRKILFVGSSLDEIRHYLEPLRISGSQQQHYALVTAREKGWESKADRLGRRYGIQVFVIQPEEAHDEVKMSKAFAWNQLALALSQLEMKVEGARSAQQAMVAAGAIQKEGDKAVALSNVAIALSQIGLKEEANQAARQALETAQAIQIGRYRAEALSAVARALLEVGLAEESSQATKQALDLALVPLIVLNMETETVVRRQLVELLGRLGGPKAFSTLLLALQDLDAGVRRAAAEALGWLGDAKAFPALGHAIEDKNPAVRQAAAEALGRLGGPEAFPFLRKAITDEDAGVRRAVAEGLTKTGDRDSLQLALETAQAIQIEGYRAEALSAVARALLKAGLAEEARQVAGQALEATEAIENEETRAVALSKLAETLAQVGSVDAAIQVARKALEATEAIENEETRAVALSKLVETLAQVGLAEEARKVARQALEVAHRIRDEASKAVALGIVSQSLAEVKDMKSLLRVQPAVQNIGPEGSVQAQLLKSLERLVARVGTLDKEQINLREPRRSTWLKKIQLVNIGPFENLDLELDRNWNILLGDNGVGKSNIVKAIALGILGRDALSYADRLIRFGTSSARIILETNENKQYITDLLRTGTSIDIRTIPGKPAEAEHWLVLGFPPARTVTWQPTVPPQLETPRELTSTEDLMPLVTGLPDPRLDKVKQWFVDIDYRIKSNPDGQYGQLLEEMKEVIRKLTGGVKLEYKRVEQDTGKIIFETDDGEVPIDAVSQGTASIVGWVGHMTQRLFEFYQSSAESIDRYALVLIDEIDAHMHPSWQQVLVNNLKELFPRVQFIATTHSPLVVSGMPVNQVFRFERGPDGKVARIEVDQDMTLGRTDQILTGELFSLPTTLDLTTRNKIDRYYELRDKSERTSEEDEEFQELQRRLQFEVPVPQQLTSTRRAQELINLLLREQIGEEYPEVQKMIQEKARQLFKAVEKEKAKQR